ncbi:MAG: efflux RND transporter periplasmic adaptor subunit [Pseudomonadota bacterium]
MKHHVWLPLAAALLAGCGADAPETADTPLRPVRVVVVSGDGEERERIFSGVSQSTQESRMSFKVTGSIQELPVQVGDQLASGDLIASLSPAPYELQVQQADASLAQAEANQRNAAANYDRVKGLYENSNASRNDLDAARAQAESAAAQVRASRKSLEIAELNASYTRLTAAGDCRVASVDVELNENVAVGSPIATLTCGADIEISLGIPESLIGGIRQGMPVAVRFNAIPGQVFAGTINEVGIASAASAATFPVSVELTESDPRIRPSMAAEVIFQMADDAGSATVVPAASVIRDGGGTFVYLAEPTSGGQAVITRQEVAIGELTSQGIEIINGLTPGDRVVTAGISVVRPQQAVLLPRD